MKRKSFKDENGKRGTVGSIVRKQFSNDPSKNEVVELIQSKGAGGTYLYFESGDSYPANGVKIIEEGGE